MANGTVALIRTLLICATIALFLQVAPLRADTAQPIAAAATPSSGDAASSDQTMDEVIVSGEQPGPPLWKVWKGDHVMYVLGTMVPLPRNITWRSREVESVIERAKEIVAQEQISANIGFFRGMRLLPAAMRARRNPAGADLKEVLTPELYARWSVLKARYMGNDKGVESYRPMVAGYELYQKAIQRSGLTRANVVWPTVRKLAKKHDVPINEPHIKVDLDDPRGLIKDFTETPRDADVACFAATLQRLETDLEPMKQRAAAWSVGDIETLERLRGPTQEATCLDAVTSVPRLQEEYTKIRARAVTEWLGIVENALTNNDVTLAVLSMNEILNPTGRLAELQRRGYTIEKP
jgi:uncharacterized protein YbaP (TraB family)